jgi:lipid A 3-O-deacylase
MSIRTKVALVVMLSLSALGSVTPSSAAHDEAVTLTIENETFTGSDSNYTNGVGISWVSVDLDIYGGKSFLNNWGRFWAFPPFISDDGYTNYTSWSVVQEMHNPDDINNLNPPKDDQFTASYKTFYPIYHVT